MSAAAPRAGRMASCPRPAYLLIEVPGAPTALVSRLTELRRDAGYRNGTYACRLPRLCADVGLVDVTVHAFPLVLTSPDDAFGLPTWVEYWRAEGRSTSATNTSGMRRCDEPGSSPDSFSP